MCQQCRFYWITLHRWYFFVKDIRPWGTYMYLIPAVNYWDQICSFVNIISKPSIKVRPAHITASPSPTFLKLILSLNFVFKDLSLGLSWVFWKWWGKQDQVKSHSNTITRAFNLAKRHLSSVPGSYGMNLQIKVNVNCSMCS